jgi:hypothetical protein
MRLVSGVGVGADLRPITRRLAEIHGILAAPPEVRLERHLAEQRIAVREAQEASIRKYVRDTRSGNP